MIKHDKFIPSAGDPASIKAGLGSVPRAINTVAWYVRAAASYRACTLMYPEQVGAEYKEALAAVHNRLAPSLLQLCEANGGVYIKAAQLATTVSAVPKQYRGYLFSASLHCGRLVPFPFDLMHAQMARAYLMFASAI